MVLAEAVLFLVGPVAIAGLLFIHPIVAAWLIGLASTYVGIVAFVGLWGASFRAVSPLIVLGGLFLCASAGALALIIRMMQDDRRRSSKP